MNQICKEILFEVISVVMHDPKNFFWIAASVAEAAPVNHTGSNTHLANGVSTFFINLSIVNKYGGSFQ